MKLFLDRAIASGIAQIRPRFLVNRCLRRFSIGQRKANGNEYEEWLKFMEQKKAKRLRWGSSLVMYGSSAILIVLGGSYAFSPMYKIFCQKTGYGGAVADSQGELDPGKMTSVEGSKPIRIHFQCNQDMRASAAWEFEPLQRSVLVRPGETALAFFRATNRTGRDMSAVAIYALVPSQAAPYFIKIQCFCFEEQKLMNGESVDMPVFFYVDPDILLDATCQGIEDMILSYSFMETSNNK